MKTLTFIRKAIDNEELVVGLFLDGQKYID